MDKCIDENLLQHKKSHRLNVFKGIGIRLSKNPRFTIFIHVFNIFVFQRIFLLVEIKDSKKRIPLAKQQHGRSKIVVLPHVVNKYFDWIAVTKVLAKWMCTYIKRRGKEHTYLSRLTDLMWSVIQKNNSTTYLRTYL